MMDGVFVAHNSKKLNMRKSLFAPNTPPTPTSPDNLELHRLLTQSSQRDVSYFRLQINDALCDEEEKDDGENGGDEKEEYDDEKEEEYALL